jgi:hypothetical protein
MVGVFVVAVVVVVAIDDSCSLVGYRISFVETQNFE